MAGRVFEHERGPAAPTPAAVMPAIAAPRAQPPLAAVIQRARANPRSLTRDDVAQLHRSIGNAAVGRLLGGAATLNRTGLPDGLKAGVEAISGLSMDDVRVHYDSPEPAAMQAHAYARGSEIHLGPGQERHLPHEAWHVVQQKQGRVRATTQARDILINDESGLEREADAKGLQASALRLASPPSTDDATGAVAPSPLLPGPAARRRGPDRVAGRRDGASALPDPGRSGAGPTDGASRTAGRDVGSAPTTASPFQFRLVVNGGDVRSERTMMNNLSGHSADGVADIVRRWMGDARDHRFRTWPEAIEAARRELDRGEGWSASQIIVVLLIMALVAAAVMGFGLPFALRRGGGRDAVDPGLPPGISPSADLHAQARALVPFVGPHLSGQPDIGRALRSMHQGPADALVPRPGGAVARLSREVALVAGPGPAAAPGESRTPTGSGSGSAMREAFLFADDADERRASLIASTREHLVSNYDTVRVYSHARAGQTGRGHQAAAVAAVEQMTRDYRDAVSLELVIHATRDAMYVFSNLLPGFDPDADEQFVVVNDQRVRVVRLDDDGSAADQQGERSVGILPADDGEIRKHGATDIAEIGALVKKLGSRKLIALQPHQWGDPDEGRFIDTGSMTYPVKSSESSIYRGNTFETSSGRSELPTVVRENVESIIRRSKSGEIDVWPVYGLHLWSTPTLSHAYGNIVENFAAAAMQYQKEKRDPKPLFIVNLSPGNDASVGRLPSPRIPRSGESGIVPHDAERNQPILEQVNIDDPIQATTSSRMVVFVNVGALPRDWFVRVMACATLPIVYEGANTGNLAHQLGRSFLPLKSALHVEVDGFEEGRKHLRDAIGNVDKEPSAETASDIANLLIAMDDENSEVRAYMREVIRLARQPEADQVLMALVKLREIDLYEASGTLLP